MAQVSGTAAAKKLDELSKEELLLKCKTYLQLAHKAKVAKNDAEANSRKYKEAADALQDRLAAVTKQKEASDCNMEDHIQTIQMQQQQQLELLQSQMEAQDRHIKRLEAENDSLLAKMDDMEHSSKEAESHGSERVSAMQDQVQHLQSCLQLKETKICNLESVLGETVSEMEAVKCRFQMITSERDALQHQLSEAQSAIGTSENRKSLAPDSLTDPQPGSAQYEDQSPPVSVAKEQQPYEMISLQEQIYELNRSWEQSKASAIQLQEENSVLLQEVDCLKGQVDQLKSLLDGQECEKPKPEKPSDREMEGEIGECRDIKQPEEMQNESMLGDAEQEASLTRNRPDYQDQSVQTENDSQRVVMPTPVAEIVPRINQVCDHESSIKNPDEAFCEASLNGDQTALKQQMQDAPTMPPCEADEGSHLSNKKCQEGSSSLVPASGDCVQTLSEEDPQARATIQMLEARVSKDREEVRCQVKKMQNEVVHLRSQVGKELAGYSQAMGETCLRMQLLLLKAQGPGGHEFDSHSEAALSTSTFSKVEEASRMADIEASFEDRYGKLKLVAIKLKKQTAMQALRIAELTASLEEQSHVKNDKKLAQLSCNFASLQSQYDLAQDVVDQQKASIQQLRQDLEMSIKERVQTKETLDAVQQELQQKTSSLANKTMEAANMEATIAKLQGLSDSQSKQVNQLLTDKAQLQESVTKLSSKLAALSEASQKQDVLDMELEKAEQRIQDLSHELVACQSELKAVQEELSIQVHGRHNGDLQIEQMQQTIDLQTNRCEELNATVHNQREQLSQLQYQLQSSNEQLDSLNQKLIKEQKERQEVAQQLAQLSEKWSSDSGTLLHKSEGLQKKVDLLEMDLAKRQEQNELLEGKLASVNKEFESYKVRAQSVLRKSKEQDANVGAKSQEMMHLERMNQCLQDQVADVSRQLEAGDVERQQLQQDHDRLMERHSLLLHDMATKDKAAKDRIEQLQKATIQAEEAVAHWQLELDRSRQTFQSERDTLSQLHSDQVLKLRQQLDEMENRILLLESDRTSSSAKPENGLIESNGGAVAGNLLLLQRGAAEGSESLDSSRRPTSVSPTHSHSWSRLPMSTTASDSKAYFNSTPPGPGSQAHLHTPVPLDQLLKDDLDWSEGGGQVSESPSNAMANSSELVDKLQVQISGAEKRIHHLSALLSDTESENSRLLQLTSVLKEEIRSYQRSEERSKHIEQLEYVKNVILKFVTLPGCEERARLIPVLSTILRLSPEEMSKLQQTINAELDRSTNSSDAGWSSYLGLWSP